MASRDVRIVRCEPSNQFQLNLIASMQIDCLPGDTPIPGDEGYWWVAQKREDGRKLNIAFACLKVCAGMPYGYLARSGVYENHQGQGLQKRLIAARERYAKALGLTHMVCDTARTNYASSNSLIRCGYKLYRPIEPWAFEDGNYWIKKL